MTLAVNRRKVLLGAGSTVLLGAFGQSAAFGLDFGSVFGTVAGAVGVGLFPGAAAALGGFELIRFLGNAADLAHNANDLVAQTQQLETHIDSVLNQVSNTLAIVQSFVQDCDNAIHDIENLIKQLPANLAIAFDQAMARAAFANLQADSGIMAGYLQSKGSIIAQRTQIQDLCSRTYREITTISQMDSNDFQFLMQVIPGLTTWMQGYTAFNLLLDGNSRGINPWDHQLVKAAVLPRVSRLLDSIRQQYVTEGDVQTQLPLDSGSIYTFDGSKFTKTSQTFAERYTSGQIDNGLYYTIYPEGVVHPPGMFFPVVGSPQPGDLCYLTSFLGGVRIWLTAPPPNVISPGQYPPELLAAERAAVVYPRLMVSTLKNVVAFHQLTEGWQVFDSAVKSNLITGDRDTWSKLPMLTA
jgi:hypothetical protein